MSAEDFRPFEVRLKELFKAKRKLAGDMLNGSGTVMPTDWSIQDIVPNNANDPTFTRALTLDDVLGIERADVAESLIVQFCRAQGFGILSRKA